jgi:osmotically-inducible protein OsmY
MNVRILALCFFAAALAACSKSDVDSVQNAVASAVPASVKSALPGIAKAGELYAKIEARLGQIDAASALHVVVRIDGGGNVKLSGSVRDAAIEKQFVAAASAVSGVKAVSSSLTVDPSLPNAKDSVTDLGLEAQVRAKLLEQGGINGVSIGVKARAGAITLTGNVPSNSVAATLVSTAKSVGGVKSVESHLQVRE